MNIQELATWNRLLALDMDAADAALPFSARLARDNGWSSVFAARAIDEYRKFCFLAVHAGHPVTPSDEVDQVWHLHLLYSQHYWEALCRETLDKPLHHGPTKGGAAENDKFNDWYEATRASYRRYFGAPTNDIWPTAQERFHERNDFVRINRRDVVTIDRTLLKRGALATLAGGGGVLAVAHALAQADGAAESRSEISFVVVLAVLLIVAFIVAVAGSRRRKSGGIPRHRASKRATHGAAGGGVSAGYTSGEGSCDGDGNCADGGSSGCGSSGCGGGGCGGGGS